MLTADQLAIRRGRIGSSQIAAIIGVSPYLTAYRLWESLTSPKTTERNGTAMQRGNILERAVCEILCAEHSRYIHRDGFTVTGEECGLPDWFVDTVDFLVRPVAGGPVECVEIKCVGSHNRTQWGDSGTQDIPPHVQCQAAWHMAAHRSPVCWVVAFFAFDDVRFYRVERDADLEAGLLSTAAEFIEAFVIPNEPPPLADTDGTDVFYRRLCRQYPGREGTLHVTPEANSEIYGVIEELRGVRAAIRHLDEREDGLMRRIVEAAGNHSAITGDFGAIRYQERPTTQWRKVAEAAGATPEMIAAHTNRAGFFRAYFRGEKEQ